MNLTIPRYTNVIEEDDVESSELFNRFGFLLLSVSGGAFIGALFAFTAWMLIKILIKKGTDQCWKYVIKSCPLKEKPRNYSRSFKKRIQPRQFKQHYWARLNRRSRMKTLNTRWSEFGKPICCGVSFRSGTGSESGLVTLNQRTIALNLTISEITRHNIFTWSALLVRNP